jgi:hypothetical protein
MYLLITSILLIEQLDEEDEPDMNLLYIIKARGPLLIPVLLESLTKQDEGIYRSISFIFCLSISLIIYISI